MVKIDSDLIYMVTENSRMSLIELSGYLKKSPQRMKYALSNLDKEGILAESYAIFDYSYFGLILFRVYFKGGYIGEDDKATILDRLRINPFVTTIYELTGEFDLVVEFLCPNPSKFNKEFKKIIQLIPTLSDYKIILNIVSYIYPRQFLTSNKQLALFNIEKIIGGDREIKEFNENELKIIKNILISPGTRLTDLANSSGLNIKTAKTILRSLEEQKIIRGYKKILDTNRLGLNKCRLFIKLHNLNQEREKELTDCMLNIKEIVQMNKTVGDWDMEIDIEAHDSKKSRLIIMQIRKEFKDLIERFNMIDFFTYYRRSYLPMFLFGDK